MAMDQSRGRSGMSRGSLRWDEEDGPTVGRGRGYIRPICASTPLEPGFQGARNDQEGDSDHEVREMRVAGETREYVDVTNLEIVHLRELLENERRVVRLLSRVSNIDLGVSGPVSLVPEPARDRESPVSDPREMPLLETMEPLEGWARDQPR
jgi:hypothetical protein